MQVWDPSTLNRVRSVHHTSAFSPVMGLYIHAVFIKEVLIPKSRWINELGSVMTITKVDELQGNFTGVYCSAVGQAEKEYALCGRFDTGGQTLGWVVSWKNKYMNAFSSTSWSGQIQIDPDIREPTIHTTWLLTTREKAQNEWNSTHIGSDTFMKVPPGVDLTKRAKLRQQCSHPKTAA